MNNNIPYFSAISREVIVKRIMDYAGEIYSFEKWKELDKGVVAESGSETRSVPLHQSPFQVSLKQMVPKFMGEKPQFKSNK